jgi:uncharacterized membrane-anchored protein YitT (DUF2179 family)
VKTGIRYSRHSVLAMWLLMAGGLLFAVGTVIFLAASEFVAAGIVGAACIADLLAVSFLRRARR